MAQAPPTFARPVKNAVYDVGTLSWVPMTQPGGGGGGGDASAANQVLELAALSQGVPITKAGGSLTVGVVGAEDITSDQYALVVRLQPNMVDAALSGFALETTQTAQMSRADTFKTRSDTFTGTANGVAVNITTAPLSTFSIQVKGTGAGATTWDIRLEGSLDGVNFSQILQHTNTTGDGAVLWIGASSAPSLYFRSRCAGLVLGGASNVVVTILGAAH